MLNGSTNLNAFTRVLIDDRSSVGIVCPTGQGKSRVVRHPGGINVAVKHIVAVSSDKVGKIVVLFIVPMVKVLQVFATHG